MSNFKAPKPANTHTYISFKSLIDNWATEKRPNRDLWRFIGKILEKEDILKDTDEMNYFYDCVDEFAYSKL